MTHREKYISILRNTMTKGISDLIDYLDDNGFFTAPASTSHHLAYDGGLCEHSLNVYNVMMDSISLGLDYKDIAIVSLLHDVGKMGYFGKSMYEPNVLKGGKVSEAKPYEVNKSIVLEHQDLSLMICSRFIELTNDQAIAIKFHNMLWTKDGYSIMGKETKLALALNFADMIASRFIENEV